MLSSRTKGPGDRFTPGVGKPSWNDFQIVFWLKLRITILLFYEFFSWNCSFMNFFQIHTNDELILLSWVALHWSQLAVLPLRVFAAWPFPTTSWKRVQLSNFAVFSDFMKKDAIDQFLCSTCHCGRSLAPARRARVVGPPRALASLHEVTSSSFFDWNWE